MCVLLCSLQSLGRSEQKLRARRLGGVQPSPFHLDLHTSRFYDGLRRFVHYLHFGRRLCSRSERPLS